MRRSPRSVLNRIRGRSRPSPFLSVGAHTYGFQHLHIHAFDHLNRIEVGRFCSIADEVHVFLGGNHRPDWVTSYAVAQNPTVQEFKGKRLGESPRSNGDVKIGNDVWIGSHASIMSGVTIGDGAVLAAFAHVVKDVRPYEIVGGNPAQHLKFRFDQETVQALLDLAWWNWPIEVLVRNHALLTVPPTPEVIERLREIAPRPEFQ